MSRPGRHWLRHPVTVFLACAASALVVFAGLARVTAMTLALERSERAALERATQEENVRIALWRLDATLADLFATESSRSAARFRDRDDPSGLPAPAVRARFELDHTGEIDTDREIETPEWAAELPVPPAPPEPEPATEPPPPPPPPPPPAPPREPENPDLDGDGVPNARDKCPNTRPGAVVDLDGCEVEAVIELQGVHFDFDKATLRPEAKVILNEAAALLEQHERVVVEVAGHTDSVGTDQYNQGLSERRAIAVRDYLIEQGVRASRLTAVGYGESRPVATNDTDEGRQQNRRVELVVLDR